MKKILITAACILGAVSGLAQGTVLFNNSATTIGGAGAKVSLPDGTGVGAGWMAQLYAGPVGGALVATGAPLPFRTSGAGLGFINTTGADTARIIAGVAGGAAADVQLRAWATASGATYEAAFASGVNYGSSTTLTVAVTGGAGEPATLPVPLTGLQGFTVIVPEPSTIALGLLGVGALLLRRRK